MFTENAFYYYLRLMWTPDLKKVTKGRFIGFPHADPRLNFMTMNKRSAQYSNFLMVLEFPTDVKKMENISD